MKKIFVVFAAMLLLVGAVMPASATASDDAPVISIGSADVQVGETFTVTECGTYTITYKVADSAENTATDKIEFAVYDPVKPTLQFDGDIAEEVKVGQKIQLPKYTIDDNNPDGVTVYRYIMAPDGTKAKIQEDSGTFTQKGTYVLTFLVTDEHNNATMYRFAVKVK